MHAQLMSAFPVCLSTVAFKERLSVLGGDVEAALRGGAVNELSMAGFPPFIS